MDYSTRVTTLMTLHFVFCDLDYVSHVILLYLQLKLGHLTVVKHTPLLLPPSRRDAITLDYVFP